MKKNSIEDFQQNNKSDKGRTRVSVSMSNRRGRQVARGGAQRQDQVEGQWTVSTSADGRTHRQDRQNAMNMDAAARMASMLMQPTAGLLGSLAGGMDAFGATGFGPAMPPMGPTRGRPGRSPSSVNPVPVPMSMPMPGVSTATQARPGYSSNVVSTGQVPDIGTAITSGFGQDMALNLASGLDLATGGMGPLSTQHRAAGQTGDDEDEIVMTSHQMMAASYSKTVIKKRPGQKAKVVSSTGSPAGQFAGDIAGGSPGMSGEFTLPSSFVPAGLPSSFVPAGLTAPAEKKKLMDRPYQEHQKETAFVAPYQRSTSESITSSGTGTSGMPQADPAPPTYQDVKAEKERIRKISQQNSRGDMTEKMTRKADESCVEVKDESDGGRKAHTTGEEKISSEQQQGVASGGARQKSAESVSRQGSSGDERSKVTISPTLARRQRSEDSIGHLIQRCGSPEYKVDLDLERPVSSMSDYAPETSGPIDEDTLTIEDSTVIKAERFTIHDESLLERFMAGEDVDLTSDLAVGEVESVQYHLESGRGSGGMIEGLTRQMLEGPKQADSQMLDQPDSMISMPFEQTGDQMHLSPEQTGKVEYRTQTSNEGKKQVRFAEKDEKIDDMNELGDGNSEISSKVQSAQECSSVDGTLADATFDGTNISSMQEDSSDIIPNPVVEAVTQSVMGNEKTCSPDPSPSPSPELEQMYDEQVRDLEWLKAPKIKSRTVINTRDPVWPSEKQRKISEKQRKIKRKKPKAKAKKSFKESSWPLGGAEQAKDGWLQGERKSENMGKSVTSLIKQLDAQRPDSPLDVSHPNKEKILAQCRIENQLRRKSAKSSLARAPEINRGEICETGDVVKTDDAEYDRYN